MFIDWEDWDGLLGTMPDIELARRIGCSLFSVYRRRSKLGIRPFGREPKKTDFSSVFEQLGKRPDTEIASTLGVAKETVAAYRKEQGIKAFRENVIKWELADNLLGVERDIDIARKLGCSVISVRERRIRLGIPTPKKRNGAKKGSTHYDTQIKPGESVSSIAFRLGCSTGTARKYKKLNESKTKWTDVEVKIVSNFPLPVCRLLLVNRSYDAIRRKKHEIGSTEIPISDWILKHAREELSKLLGQAGKI